MNSVRAFVLSSDAQVWGRLRLQTRELPLHALSWCVRHGIDHTDVCAPKDAVYISKLRYDDSILTARLPFEHLSFAAGLM